MNIISGTLTTYNKIIIKKMILLNRTIEKNMMTKYELTKLNEKIYKVEIYCKYKGNDYQKWYLEKSATVCI